MRFHTSALTGVCLCSLIASGAPSNATTTRAPRTIVIPAGVPRGQVRTYPAPVRPGQVRRISRHGRRFSVPTCTGAGQGSFVGGTDNNVAAGADSAVLGGNSNDACDDLSGIGVGEYNGIGGGNSGDAFIGGGFQNAIVSSGRGFIGAGYSNTISGTSSNNFIGAGESNTNSGLDGVIVGGSFNIVSASYSGIGAGPGNTVSAPSSFIAAGYQNNINGATYPAAASNSFIGAGAQNTIKALAANGGLYGVIGGGGNNILTGQYAVIGGGSTNRAPGAYASVPGGYQNYASGFASFAGGNNAAAVNTGAFAWSDSAGGTRLVSSASNQFLVKASGGVKFFSNASLSTGVMLGAGSGTWASVSDRAIKTNVSAIDDAGILDKVASLPISEWSNISEHGVRHVGPMAQDFYAAFGVGADNKHITSIDEDGVALAAIKALHSENSTLKARLAKMEGQLQKLSVAVNSMHSR